MIPEGFLDHVRWGWVDHSAREWLDALPATLGVVLDDWKARPDGEVRFGAEGIAVPVLTDDGAAVVKFQQPTEEFRIQARSLADWAGRGMVRLLRADLDRGALLLERLDASHQLADEPVEVALAEVARLLRRTAVPAPAGALDRYPRTRDLVRGVRTSLDERNAAVAHPLGARMVAAVQRACDELLADDDPGVLVDADLHHDNALRRCTGNREWTALDPRPMVGDPAHQVPQLLWTLEDRLPHDASAIRQHLALVAAEAELEPDRARCWTLVRGADYWLWGVAHGLTEDPERCRRILASVLSR